MTGPVPEQDPAVWRELAAKYAEHIDPVTAPYAADCVRLAEIEEGERVLDVACGAGAATLAAARAGAEVLATDITPEFVDRASRRAERAGLAVETRVVDGQSMDLPDDAFDAVISNFGVFLFPEREKGFEENLRVLKPGGRAVITAFVGPPRKKWMALMGEAVRQTFPEMPPASPPKFLELADAQRFEGELREAGFAAVNIETIDHRARWADDAQAWAAIAESAPVFRPLFEKLGPDGVARLRRTFGALWNQRASGGGPVELASPAHFAVARKG